MVIMRKPVKYDKKYITEVMRYAKVPVRQILLLDLKPLSHLVLIHLFSHSQKWGISINQISKSFSRTKNRSSIKNSLDELIQKGYLLERNDAFVIDLEKIQNDSTAKNQGGDTNTINDTNTIMLDDSNNTRGVIGTLPGGDSVTTRVDDSSTTSNYINNKIKKENKEINQSINEISYIDAISLLNSIKFHIHEGNPKNDLKRVTEGCSQFRVICEHDGHKWGHYDINHLSNNQLANLAFIHKTNKEEFRKFSKLLVYIFLLVKYSFSISPKLELSKEFEDICYANNRTDLLEEFMLS